MTPEWHDRVPALWAQYGDAKRIAAEIGVTVRQVQRVKHQLGLTVPIPRYSSADVERIKILTAEGLPTPWVAEDIGRTYMHVARVAASVPERAENVREWQIAWAQIKNHPELVELHRQFCPPAGIKTRTKARTQ